MRYVGIALNWNNNQLMYSLSNRQNNYFSCIGFSFDNDFNGTFAPTLVDCCFSKFDHDFFDSA
jgi:hypothetical protein